MNRPLHILHVEDNTADAELAQDTLEMEGVACDVTRVETESTFLLALHKGGFDVILADYALPSFDGLSALRIARRQRPDLPFIFVSGTMGEEVAIEALKIGATDYVLKTRMSRLVPSVHRALREARERAELRRAEQALRRSEAYLAIAQSLSHTGSFGWDVASGEIFWSLETYHIFELDPLTMPTLELILERVHPDDALRVKETLGRISLDRTDFHFEHRLLVPERRVKYLRISGRAVDSPSDVSFVGAVTDITAAKEAERQLREREVKIRRLVDANIVGVLISDLEGRVTDANDAFLQMVRYTRDDLARGRLCWTELTPPEWQPASERAVAQLRANGTCELFEKEYFRSDGSRVPVLVAAAAIEGGTKAENVAFVLDLTERKLAEAERERLRQLQIDLAYMSRVITVGQLGASLAHEIKQPIGSAVTNAEACVRLLDRDEPNLSEAREAAFEMVRDAKRAADIIDRVRSLYQKGSSEPAMVDVNEVIGEMVIMLQNEANRYSVSMRADLAEGLPTVMADRVQLQQALMNLMLNGIEAMNDTSGELSVRSKITEDGQLLISVSDCGIGLPVKQVERIFDAFFTTKPHGTGMGLSISRTIIESYGGHLWATPNAEHGATFHFTLPTKVTASSPSAA
jgi:PAS domain S-box-containing protein